MYYTLREHFYCPSLAADCYGMVRQCPECAKNRAHEETRRTKLTLFPAKEPLDFIAIDILGPFLTTERGNNFLLVITDRFTKLTRDLQIAKKSSDVITEELINNWITVYGPPRLILSGNA